MTLPVKRCNTCKKKKTIDWFYKSASNSDGRQGDCSVCKEDKRRRRRASRIVDVPDWKRCSACGVRKRCEAFSPYIDSKDGLTGKCKACLIVYYHSKVKKAGPGRIGRPKTAIVVSEPCGNCGAAVSMTAGLMSARKGKYGNVFCGKSCASIFRTQRHARVERGRFACGSCETTSLLAD